MRSFNGFVLNPVDQGDFRGGSVASAGDVNGDGIDDLLIGAYREGEDGTLTSETYVVFGSTEARSVNFELSTLDGQNGFVLNGLDDENVSGTSVASAGDVNGDGIDDLLIGAEYAGMNGAGSGETFVVFGSASGFGASLDLSSLDGTNGFVVNGVDAGDFSGSAVSSAGDVNGDGIDDILIGAPGDRQVLGNDIGQSYVVFGSASGFDASLELSALDGTNGFALGGGTAGDYAGASVSSAGDVNGDGIDDILIGAAGATGENFQSGKTYVVFGSANGFDANLDLSALDGSDGFVLNGVDIFDSSGAAVSSVGDVNNDGVDDIIIGAAGADRDGTLLTGESYVVYGSATGFDASFDLSSLDGDNGFVLNAVDVGDLSGYSVSSAGDVNGDGISDILLVSYGADPEGYYTGEAYVVYGSETGFDASFDLASLDGSNGFALNGVHLDDYSGRSASAAGDLNGDGFDDIVMGAYGPDATDETSGKTFVVFGGAANVTELDGTDGAVDGVINLASIDNDIFDSGASDNIRGTRHGDSFVMLDDGQHDRIRDFELGKDKFDMSDFGALSFDALTITNQIRRDGSISWVSISDGEGDREIRVRYDDAPLDANALSSDDFIFAQEGTFVPKPATQVNDSLGNDNINGVAGAEVFVMLDDGQNDRLKNFEIGTDKIDMQDFGQIDFADLILANQVRKDGSISWVSISDGDGDREIRVRFDDAEMDASQLSAEDFIFADDMMFG